MWVGLFSIVMATAIGLGVTAFFMQPAVRRS
jgi:hypothetical protein